MRVDLFDFDLPQDRIALRPANPRDSARLLLVEGEKLTDHFVRDLVDLLNPGDLLVMNDTRVLPARLFGVREPRDHGGGQGARIEITLHMRLDERHWRCFCKPMKRLRTGDTIHLSERFKARVELITEAGEVELSFDAADGSVLDAIHEVGSMPLPPYIASKRAVDKRDLEDYQTVMAKEEGSVAAPTAGLHFTPELLEKLADKGIETETVTLHVGAGTFLPVKVEDTNDHRMHAEWGRVTERVVRSIETTKQTGGRVICVGTTSLRLIESAARGGTLRPFEGQTDIFITPGFEFQVADGLMTNFHLPRSTLFMLVSAFLSRENMLNAYKHAIDNGYRFYSYGDGSLLLRADKQ